MKRIKKIRFIPLKKRHKIPRRLKKIHKKRLVKHYIKKIQSKALHTNLNQTYLLKILYQNKAYLKLTIKDISLK